MKIILFGASGFIGTQLVKELCSEHYVTVVTRNKNSTQSKLNSNIHIVEWDYKHSSALLDILSGTDVVMNLAGENIASKLWTKKQKNKIKNSRINAGKKITEAIKQSKQKPKLLIQASAIGYYGANPTKKCNESAATGDGFLAEVCHLWEKSTEEVEQYNVKRAIIRLGVVLGKTGGMLNKLSNPIRYYLGVKLGNGKNYISWIHINDLIMAINYIMKNNKQGIFNFTSPQPVTMQEFILAIAKKLKKPVWFSIPAIIIKKMLGKMAQELLLANQFVTPDKLQQEGYVFQYKTLDSALDSLL